MEKYAVVIDDEKSKTASKDKVCPQCGKAINPNPKEGDATSDWWCATCGTEPFEKKPVQPAK